MTDLALGRRRHVRVPGRADHVLDTSDRDSRRLGHAGKRPGTVVGEVAVDLPGLAEVIRALDEHGSRTERLEPHDEVGEVELSLEV